MFEGFLKRRGNIRGFTLIELSIVLVVIGLIVGGILTGQSLIAAAEVRAQLTQIEKYQSAVNTFRIKFNALPGDMRPEIATQFGFAVGASCSGSQIGTRNGDGLIDGYYADLSLQGTGETGLFWQDLSSTAAGNLIDGTYPGNGTSFSCASVAYVTSNLVGLYFPAAKLGKGDFLYVYDDFYGSSGNWYGLSAVTSSSSFPGMSSSPNISVSESYNIDKKIDDGLPSTGNVQAKYINANSIAAPNSTTAGGDSTSCYDTTTGTYSVTVNNGNGGNCALSFKFQ